MSIAGSAVFSADELVRALIARAGVVSAKVQEIAVREMGSDPTDEQNDVVLESTPIGPLLDPLTRLAVLLDLESLLGLE